MPKWPIIDRLAARMGIWALRRLYGECDQSEPTCIACQATRLIEEMEDVAYGRD